jgi:pyruvate kinase
MSRVAIEAEQHLLAGAALPAGDDAGLATGSARGTWATGREAGLSGLHDALALGVERIARSLEVRAIVAVTRSGATARYLASSRPRVPVLALTPNPRALGRLALYWGITPFATPPTQDPDELLRRAEAAVLDTGLAVPGDPIVVAVGREEPGAFAGRIHIHRLRPAG